MELKVVGLLVGSGSLTSARSEIPREKRVVREELVDLWWNFPSTFTFPFLDSY